MRKRFKIWLADALRRLATRLDSVKYVPLGTVKVKELFIDRGTMERFKIHIELPLPEFEETREWRRGMPAEKFLRMRIADELAKSLREGEALYNRVYFAENDSFQGYPTLNAMFNFWVETEDLKFSAAQCKHKWYD